MADVAQVIYEYTDGNTVSFFTNDLRIKPLRPGLKISRRVDGTLVVIDTNASQRQITCSAMLDGDTWKTLHDVQIGSITYSGAYPRLTTINFDGDTTVTNIEVAMTVCDALDLGNGYWWLIAEWMEKDQ